MGLVLGAREGEAILIGNDIRIEVVRIGPTENYTRLKITAPKDVLILRESLLTKSREDAIIDNNFE